MSAFTPPPGRVDWVDTAKGFCIVMVVMMHSTLGVEAAAGREGWMHALVEFARPFRMPDFFLAGYGATWRGSASGSSSTRGTVAISPNI